MRLSLLKDRDPDSFTVNGGSLPKREMNGDLSPRFANASNSLAEAYLKSGRIKNVMNFYL